MGMLCIKSNNERVKILEDNKKYLAKGVNDDNSDEDEDKDSEDSETEMKKVKDKLAKMSEDNKMDDEDDDTDSDYEYTGGDLALYDSALDDIDELGEVK